MQFILTAGWDDGIADLTERLVHELAAGKKVLWLTSGGSNVEASVQVMSNISADLSRNLSIMPADERFGPPGHANSNWTQLMQAGFKPEQAKLLPVLKEGQGETQTAQAYNQLAEQAFMDNDVIIAQLGIGEDGHIAGILPESEAAKEEKALVVGYNSQPYSRLTLTFPALRQLTAVYAFAFGNTKQPTLNHLKNEDLPLNQQPAQVLKELPEVYIYNDQVGM